MHESFDDHPEASDHDHRVPARRHTSTFGTVLMAAMIGLADALGWDRPRDRGEIVQLAPDLDTGDLPLDFGPLPPLDS